ncbi:MAG: hypothetical protein IJ835_02335 [Muribaculaceae bacterium]|nr:hypothetical protein [Muribaculaceae bacterium]
MKKILLLMVALLVSAVAWSQTVVVTRPGVNLRMGPSVKAGTLINSRTKQNIHPKQWERLPYLGQSGNFFKTRYLGYEVYISKDYSRLEGTSSGSSSYSGKTYVYVDGYHVRFRTGPSTSYPYLTTGKGGTLYAKQYSLLPYLGQSGDFYMVDYNGYTVYISRDYTHLVTR